MSQLYIVILTYNGYADTHECLTSILPLLNKNTHCIVVDNASSDDTFANVRQFFPQVTLIENKSNLGVPRGYNIGFRYALEHGADAVLMLNNDTVLAPDMLQQLGQASMDERVGIAVPIAYEYHRPQHIWSAGASYRAFPPAFVMDNRITGQLRQLDYAIACCILITRRAFERVGLLDESIFFMWEDLEFCQRVRNADLHIVQVPTAKMWHKVSQTTQPGKPLFWQMHGESSVLYFRRHSRWPRLAVWLNMGWFGLREFVLKGRPQFIAAFLAGLRSGWQKPLLAIPQPLNPHRPAPTAIR